MEERRRKKEKIVWGQGVHNSGRRQIPPTGKKQQDDSPFLPCFPFFLSFTIFSLFLFLPLLHLLLFGSSTNTTSLFLHCFWYKKYKNEEWKNVGRERERMKSKYDEREKIRRERMNEKREEAIKDRREERGARKEIFFLHLYFCSIHSFFLSSPLFRSPSFFSSFFLSSFLPSFPFSFSQSLEHIIIQWNDSFTL